jgi:hypothetical protein
MKVVKVEYVNFGDRRWAMVATFPGWQGEVFQYYTRRSDAVRGFERFCRAIEKARKA